MAILQVGQCTHAAGVVRQDQCILDVALLDARRDQCIPEGDVETVTDLMEARGESRQARGGPSTAVPVAVPIRQEDRGESPQDRGEIRLDQGGIRLDQEGRGAHNDEAGQCTQGEELEAGQCTRDEELEIPIEEL